MAVNTCPSYGLQSFPVDVGFALVESSYKDAKNIPLKIQFQWGTRTSAPVFSSAKSGVIDHVQNDVETTIQYNNKLYNLGSVQITSPTHNRWIVPVNEELTKADNLEDIVITYEIDTFSKSKDTDPKYIILVNPILRTNDTVKDPQYLVNLANGTASSVTLAPLFPYTSGTNYVYYTTCVPGNTLQSHYKNILVLLNPGGILVSSSLMTSIKKLYNSFSEGNYPVYVPLGNFTVKSSVISKVTGLTTMEGFQNMLGAVSNPSSNPQHDTGQAEAPVKVPPPTTQSYNSMKCVQFDPERNLTKNGSIVIDTSTGVPFKLDPNTSVDTMRKVLGALKDSGGNVMYPNAASLTDKDARAKYLSILPDTARTNSKNFYSFTRTGKYSFTSVEKTLTAFCAIIMLIIIGLICFSFFSNINSITEQRKKDIWLWIWWFIELIGLNVGLFIAGFFIGIYTLPASCPSNTVTS
jgi:hypothetical protein